MNNKIPDFHTWLQERPGFCPYADCKVMFRVMDSMCGGELPSPEAHKGDFNTHRLCLFDEDDGMPVYSLQINEADVGWFRMIFDEMFGEIQG